MKTYMAKTTEAERKWVQIDAEGQILGRLATRIATILMGKHRPTYTPHADVGDFVIITNVEKIRVTGRKMEQKMYQYYTGYPGGRREVALKNMLARKPQEVMRLAVRRMLPKGALGNKMLKKLKLYVGAEHPHQAQEPKLIAGVNG